MDVDVEGDVGRAAPPLASGARAEAEGRGWREGGWGGGRCYMRTHGGGLQGCLEKRYREGYMH